ncbi:hypothetical protein Pcinc_003450 [Petrolisthes cinctipes]|uniref:Uncharacterized protein n=1 Tax=Petrolisthes cinctipes TaxID=88211 RepID=A0AAE1L2F8_PETCI|nr:hypothetical protein Pcinc_003450 [Petrolisthes cinctipes]
MSHKCVLPEAVHFILLGSNDDASDAGSLPSQPDEVEEEEQVEEKRENDELPTHATPKLNSLQPLPKTPIATTSRCLPRNNCKTHLGISSCLVGFILKKLFLKMSIL